VTKQAIVAGEKWTDGQGVLDDFLCVLRATFATLAVEFSSGKGKF
jgi:hypothetical protein